MLKRLKADQLFCLPANMDPARLLHVLRQRDHGDLDVVLGGLRVHQQQRHRAGVHQELEGGHGAGGSLHHHLTHLPHRLHLGENVSKFLFLLNKFFSQ